MNHHASKSRAGLTLTEVLVATTVTTLVVGAVAGFSHAALQAWEVSTQSGNSTQAGRVVLTHIAQTVSTSRHVLNVSNIWGSSTNSTMPVAPGSLISGTTLTGMTTTLSTDQVLLVWEHDGEAGDPTPGQPNFVELVIFAPHKEYRQQLMELRPAVDASLVVPLDQPDVLLQWITRFRRGENVRQPPAVLLGDLGGIHFEVDEFREPQGASGIVQQNVRIGLCVSSPNQPASVFFGSAMRRYFDGR
jgi:hypothetical protein